MSSQLLVSLALCQLAWARPRLDGELEAISNLQLLIPILVEKSLSEQEGAQGQAAPARSPHLAPEPPRGTKARAHREEPRSLYSDGPFSDIPADAFHLEHRKELQRGGGGRAHGGGGSAREDPGRGARVPDDLVRTCLDYFREGSRARTASSELILNICSELLDDGGVEDFTVDQSRAEDHQHHLNCECCPLQHGAGAGVGARAGADSLLGDLLELLQPGEPRPHWQVIDLESPDEHEHSH